MVSVCTGENSWGIPYESQLDHKWERMSTGEVCHNFSSTTEGNPDDNPWNPKREDKNGNVVGLTTEQREKAFIAAYWDVTNFEATFSVKPMEGFTSRNIMFTGHGSTFCEGWKAEEVKE